VADNEKYIIGIDGGATKTTAVISDISGNILAELSGGPGNFLIIGVDKVAKTISDLILDVCNQAEVNSQNVEIVYIGLTGAGREADAEKMKNALNEFWNARYSFSLKNVIVTSDARIALEGAFSGNSGIILIAGTGSIMFAKDRNEEIHRVGGFGRFIGDEGSGYSIGRCGLSAIAKSFDGRFPETKLTEIIAQNFSIHSAEDLINAVYKEGFDLALVAPFVIQCAEEGDEICREILRKEVDELVLHVKAIKNKIKLKTVSVAFIGGLISSENYFVKLLRKNIMQKVEGITVVNPEHPPAYGAVLLGMESISIEER
jgi:N-acetylglucosamine kinase-like BadF-type ATPase